MAHDNNKISLMWLKNNNYFHVGGKETILPLDLILAKPLRVVT